MEPLKKQDPKKIGPYTLVARLGSGGMGTVYLASRSEATVALKVVSGGFDDDPALKNRFIREIENLRKTRSAFIAGIIDSKVEESNAWLAVRYINGPNLFQEISRHGPLSEQQLWEVAIGGLVAISQIHASGVIHRDIKPANILLSETGPKLIDFGISHRSDDTSLTTTGLVAGSPAWLAPEQLDIGDVSSAADIFSFASTLVFASTGQSPWGDHSSMSVPILFNKILSETADLSKMSKDLKNTFIPAFSKDPKARPSALELLEASISIAPLVPLERIKGWITLEAGLDSKKLKQDFLFAKIVPIIDERISVLRRGQTEKQKKESLQNPAQESAIEENVVRGKPRSGFRKTLTGVILAGTLSIGAVLGASVAPVPLGTEDVAETSDVSDSVQIRQPIDPPTYMFTTVSNSGIASLSPGEGAVLVEGEDISITLRFNEGYVFEDENSPALKVAAVGADIPDDTCIGDWPLEPDPVDLEVFRFDCEGLPSGQYLFRVEWTLSGQDGSGGNLEKETISAFVDVIEEQTREEKEQTREENQSAESAARSAGFTFEFLGGGWLSWDSPRKYSTSGNSLIRAWCERGKVGWGWGDNGNWAEIIDANGTAIETVAQTESTGTCILENTPGGQYDGDPAEGRRIVVPASWIEPRLVPGECLYLRFKTHGDYDDVCLRGR